MPIAYFLLKNYVENDPGFCAHCHQTRVEYALWTRSSHRSIVCQKCHHQSPGEGFDVLWKVVFGGGTGEKKLHHPDVAPIACAECHMRHDTKWQQIGGSAGHKVHMEDGKIDCMRCHARLIHEFAPTEESCTECHPPHNLLVSGMERLHCLACHNFLTQEETIKPQREQCLECHRAKGVLEPSWPENAPMTDFPCYACHRPHREKEPTPVACHTCHAVIERHGLHKIEDHQDCGNCHKPHAWTPQRKSCTECHDDMISHYAHKKCWECHDFSTEENPK